MVSDIVMKKLVVLSMLVIGVKCIFPANLHEILFNVSWNFDGYRNPFVNPPTGKNVIKIIPMIIPKIILENIIPKIKII